MRVEGVLHEFSPIPGAMEDTTDLILNLKRVPLKMHVEHPKTLLLKTSEAGEVRAKHITPDPDVEVLDPESYIATLGQGSTLAVEMRVKQGRGYVSADKNFDEDLSIGWIPVDSVHSPIKKVNYFVDAARVGDEGEALVGPNLATVGSRQPDPDWFVNMLRDPSAHERSRMPSFGHLPDDELRALAEYLRSLR